MISLAMTQPRMPRSHSSRRTRRARSSEIDLSETFVAFVFFVVKTNVSICVIIHFKETNMPRIALDLNNEEDRRKVKGEWRIGPGLVPGEPNEGLTAQLLETAARSSSPSIQISL